MCDGKRKREGGEESGHDEDDCYSLGWTLVNNSTGTMAKSSQRKIYRKMIDAPRRSTLTAEGIPKTRITIVRVSPQAVLCRYAYFHACHLHWRVDA